MPDFTVITPVFNGEAFIEETIESVLNAAASYSFEYLVIDDGSTDSTPEILEKFGKGIKVTHQANLGQAKTISNALVMAEGKYSIIVNADDPLFTSSLFEDSKQVLENNPEVVATYPDWQILDSKGNVVSKVMVREFSIQELVGNFNCLVGPGGIFKTSVAKSIGGWNPSYKFVPDYEFWLRMSDFGDFRHIAKVQASWREHEHSISVYSRGNMMAKERIRVMSEYIERHPDLPKQFKKRALSSAHFRAAMLSYFDPEVKGRSLVFKAVRYRPLVLIEKDFRVIIYCIFLPFSSAILRKCGMLTKMAKRVALKARLS